MAETREDRIASMRESMNRLSKEYGVEEPPKKSKPKKKPKKKSTKMMDDGAFSAVGLAGKIQRRKGRNLAETRNASK
jgi:hypothetical protein